MDSPNARRLCYLALTTWLLSPPGCSALNSENHVLTKQFAEDVQPKSVAARVALAPVVVPAAIVALTFDDVLIHPVRMIPVAWEDANGPFREYWRPDTMSGIRKAVVLVPVVPLTAFCFIASWSFQSVLGKATKQGETT